MSSSYDRISVMGLLTANEDLFTEMQLPSGIEKEDVINNILMECCELEVLYPDPAIMQKMIGLWSRKYLPGWTKALDALQAQYNPIHNFDRYETWSEAGKNSRTGSSGSSSASKNDISSSEAATGNSSEVNTMESDNKNSVMGFNQSEGWADHDKSQGSGTNTVQESSAANKQNSESQTGSVASTENHAETGSDDRSHTGHLFGNIGVTKSQDMVRDEWLLRIELNFVDMVTTSFKKAFCVLVY